ncbi:MAG TPA: two-component sensor histidine kinase [Bacteroidales bacterium]|nr:two-component sensor histidine kinase [Bacteroidales bacterium]
MEEEYRPDPDELLKKIQLDEEKKLKGKLKIFFGMCAGVGKTYSMLEFAHQTKKDGFNIVIGYIETHGRAETMKLLEGLEIIPRKKVSYKDVMLEEMDLDAILIQKPKIVLVDELAHTNVPGSRHLKRYQDVLEILDNGIDVYTTVNVQHLESRAGTVLEITGVRINETVPDSIIDNANEIELIDISPDDLLKRLAEGKVYVPEKAANAVNNFFRKGNLHALRELSLRLTAERVDMDLLDYMHAKKIITTWKTSEKLMVAVGPGPYSQNLIRWTRRMAYNLDAPWIAVSIDLDKKISEKNRKALSANLELAKELGAKIVHVIDFNVVSGLLRAANDNNVSQIVIGKTKESLLANFLKGGSLVDKLIKNSNNIDVYVVNTEKEFIDKKQFTRNSYTTSSLKEYITSIIIISLFSIVCFPIREIIGYQTIGLFFLLAIASISLFLGRGPVILSAFFSTLIWDYFFIPPLFELAIHKFHDYISLFSNLIIGIILGTLINRIRKNQHILKKSQENISTTFYFLELMNNASSIKDVISKTNNAFKKYFDIEMVVYLKEKKGIHLHNRPFGNTSLYSEKEFAVASWAFDNKKNAGKFTNTLPSSGLKFIPLIASGNIIGVAGIKFNTDNKPEQDKLTLINSIVNQLTYTLIREINIDLVKHIATTR